MANALLLIGLLIALSVTCDAAPPASDHTGATNDDIMDMIKKLVVQMHSMDGRMHNLENQGDRIETRMQITDQKINTMDSRMRIMDQKIDKIETDTSDMMNLLAKEIKVEDKKIQKNTRTLEKISAYNEKLVVMVENDLKNMSKDVQDIK